MKRLLVVLMLVAFSFIAVFARLIYVEVVDSENLQTLALEQWYRDIPLQAERGKIYDREGVLLAGNTTTYTLYARPVAIKDKEQTARILADVLALDYEKILKRLQSRTSELTIKKGLDKDVMLKLLNSSATGLYFSRSVKRVYPYGDFLTQVLGFTNVDSEGQTGLEAYYEQYLGGKDGYVLTETDLVGRELDTGTTYYKEGIEGASAYLTVDYYIQSFAETAVRDAHSKFASKSASCIVMDVNTGEILAMAKTPAFDLNNVPRNDVLSLMNNSKQTLITDVFEPGSTFKIVTSALGLDTGAVSRNYRCYCGGSMLVDSQKIKCWRTIGHGSINFDEGVKNSCNCLFMNIALNLGVERFYDGIEKFGLMQKTGIDASGESHGITIKESLVKNVDLARIGFGQAIAVTPISLLRACSAVVNGGVLVTPHIVDKFVDKNGNIVYQNAVEIVPEVIKRETSIAMREVLEKVVSEGSGKNAQVPGYRISGKTGTAQKYENGAIARGKYVSTFIGFAPANEPKYACLMVVDEPQGAYYGSIVSAPYVGEIFSKIFAYKGIAPTENVEEKERFAMPDIEGVSVSEGILALRARNLYYEISGEGVTITKQFPVAGAMITSDTVCYVETE